MKNKLIVLQIFIVMILICTSVYAAVQATVGVKVSSSTLSRGDTFQATITLSDVQSGEKITGVEGYLIYDKDILEKVTVDNILKDSDNKVKIGNDTLPVEDMQKNPTDTGAFVGFNGEPTSGKGDAKILIDFNNAITKDTDLITFEFKIKSDAKIGDIKDVIKFSEFTIAVEGGNPNDITTITRSINLTIKEKNNNNQDQNQDQDKDKEQNKNTENKSENPVGKVNNTNSNNKTNNTNKVSNTNTDNTVSGTKLPATGAKIFIIPAIVLIALAYVSYNRYIRMRGI